MAIDHIRDDFELLDDWEDRYRYVMELGRALPPLDEALRTDANKVGRLRQLGWLASTVVDTTDGKARTLKLVGDSDAHLVRGLVAIIIALYDDVPLDQIPRLDAEAALAMLSKEHLTPQRSNGVASMIKRIRADAETAVSHGC